MEWWSIRNRFWLHLESMWGPFWKQIGVRLGSILGSIWGPCRDLAGIRASDPVGTRFLIPWTDLGVSLGPHVGPMLAPCWRRSGVLRGPWAFLGRSKGHLEFNFDQHGKGDEKERLDFRKKPAKYCVFQWLLKVPKIGFG